MASKNDVPFLHSGPSPMVRPIIPGLYNPALPIGERGAGEIPNGGCRAIQCDADGLISFYDYTETLITNFPVKKYNNPFGIKALTASNVNVWAVF